MLEQLKNDVCRANKELVKNGLVKWTSGNVSARDSETGYIVIKPSGVLFDDLKPEDMIVVNLNGDVVEGELKPSVDTISHLVVYRNRSDVNSIVHTHSPYATSFAIVGEPLQIYTTTAAAVFGGDIPVSDFVTIGNDEIGNEIANKIGHNKAILIRNHGVFTIGNTISSALKYAVVLEETAEATHYALCRSNPNPLTKEVVDRGYDVYKKTYGQF